MKPKLPDYKKGEFKNNWWEIKYFNRNKTEDNTMKTLIIETVTLVNDVRTTDLSIDSIIELIESEKAKLKKLENLEIKSKAIDNLINKHSTNINLLIEILDKE